MTALKKMMIAAVAAIAVSIAPLSSAFAAGIYSNPVNGKHVVHKGGPGYHYKKGPRVTYPRGYHKHRPPAAVHKGKNNTIAAGILGFAAGALVGKALK